MCFRTAGAFLRNSWAFPLVVMPACVCGISFLGRGKETSVKSSTGLHCVHEGHWVLHFSVTTCYVLSAFLIFIFVRFSGLFGPAYAGVASASLQICCLWTHFP